VITVGVSADMIRHRAEVTLRATHQLIDWSKLPISLATTSFAYPHIEQTMRYPQGWSKALWFALVACFVLYFTIAVAGYTAFGNETVNPVLGNLPQGNPNDRLFALISSWNPLFICALIRTWHVCGMVRWVGGFVGAWQVIANSFIILHVLLAAPIFLKSLSMMVEASARVHRSTIPEASFPPEDDRLRSRAHCLGGSLLWGCDGSPRSAGDISARVCHAHLVLPSIGWVEECLLVE